LKWPRLDQSEWPEDERLQMVMSRRDKKKVSSAVRVQVKGSELRMQDSVKYLGVEIDHGLTWKTHIEKMRKQCKAKLSLIHRTSSYLVPTMLHS